MSKDKLVLPEDGSVQNALHQFQKGEGDGFVVFGFPAGNNALGVIGEGAGGLTEAAALFPDDDVRYALLRKTHKVELATTTKFSFISWTPEGVKPLRKALLSTLLPQVSEVLKPFHVNFNWSDRSELQEKTILDKIGASAGTASHVVDATASESKHAAAKPRNAPLVPSTIKDDRKLNIADEEALNNAIKQLRADDSATNWVVVQYNDNNVDTLVLKGSGSGGLEELAAQLDETQVQYGLFRVTETFDKTQRAMFGFFKLLSDNVTLPPMKKALISTHMGFVSKIFQPFHVEFLLNSASEFTPDMVHNRIQTMMGTRSNVRTNDEAKALKPTGSAVAKSHGPSVASASSTAKIGFTDEEAFKNALKGVRSDSPDSTWLLTSYSAKDTLTLIRSGAGGVEELVGALEDGNVNFGLLRVTEQIDKSITTKFVYIKWIPDSVPYMRKADVGTKKGPIDDIFRPFHVDVLASDKSELNSAAIADKVASASGAKNNVRSS
jgi:hypothetical protein